MGSEAHPSETLGDGAGCEVLMEGAGVEVGEGGRLLEGWGEGVCGGTTGGGDGWGTGLASGADDATSGKAPRVEARRSARPLCLA